MGPWEPPTYGQCLLCFAGPYILVISICKSQMPVQKRVKVNPQIKTKTKTNIKMVEVKPMESSSTSDTSGTEEEEINVPNLAPASKSKTKSDTMKMGKESKPALKLISAMYSITDGLVNFVIKTKPIVKGVKRHENILETNISCLSILRL